MKTKEYRTVDKSDWGDGPWQNEPDKVQWQDEATGLPCLIVRNRHGALCGYVGVTEGHSAFGKDYDEVNVSVHDGGITFADFCNPRESESEGICHLPDPGEPDHVYWLGFDCNHSGDVAPLMRLRMLRYSGSDVEGLFEGDTYKTIDYVKAEVTQLAAQLAAL